MRLSFLNVYGPRCCQPARKIALAGLSSLVLNQIRTVRWYGIAIALVAALVWLAASSMMQAQGSWPRRCAADGESAGADRPHRILDRGRSPRTGTCACSPRRKATSAAASPAPSRIPASVHRRRSESVCAGQHPVQGRRRAGRDEVGSGEGRGRRQRVQGIRRAGHHAAADAPAHHLAGRQHAEDGSGLGTQTRLFHFGPPADPGRLDYSNATLFPSQPQKFEPPPAVEPSAQGYSIASWTIMGGTATSSAAAV